MTTRTTSIPFSGFYESSHDDILDRALEQVFADENGNPDDEAQSGAWDAIDWRAVHLAYAQHYCEALADACEATWTYAKLDSPREYNFRSDEIDVSIDLADLERMHTAVDPETFASHVKRRCTSRDGFISFYSPDLADWGDLEDWEAPQLALLLDCYCDLHTDRFQRDWEMVEDGNGEITAMIENAIPSDKLTAIYNALDAKRSDRAA